MIPNPDDVRTAIATVKASRQTHIEWRDYWNSLPCGDGCATCAPTAAVAGGLDHQETCIRRYDQVLAVLTSLLPEETP